tara:strand:+ start:1310 stop:2368 length:1059 start_codon:yes stop_codon:yes gene_type:complete
MKTLILPMAGKSSRFPNQKPKWMLTHPRKNCFMVVESISGINLDFFDSIIFVVLKEHEEKFNFTDGLRRQLDNIGILDKSKIVHLKEKTNSQSETVYQAIKEEKIEGFICVKDSDGKFETVINNEKNQVCYCDLNSVGKLDAGSKSYIEMDQGGVITNIVEKKVISSTFSVGGYCFSSAKEFCNIYDSLKMMEGECYISHVIYEMLLQGKDFYGLKCLNFEDYGTSNDWNEFKSKFKTVFVDLDGTLIENTGEYLPPYRGSGKLLKRNADTINKMFDSGFVYVIITTSRPESSRKETEEELERNQINYHNMVMGLPHCGRILINDFAPTNLYPSAKAINISRNSDNLEDFLK